MQRIRSSSNTDCWETSRRGTKLPKGAACRRHNELFVSKRFEATETTKQLKAVKIDEKTKKVKREVVDEGPHQFTKSTLKKG
ncbi:peptidyl-prolyl cis-trans isomerase FKBP3-like [Stigmatopora argus]